MDGIFAVEILRFAQDDTSASAPRHHFQKQTFEIFRFGNRRQDRMIWCLLEPAQASSGTPGIDERI